MTSRERSGSAVGPGRRAVLLSGMSGLVGLGAATAGIGGCSAVAPERTTGSATPSGAAARAGHSTSRAFHGEHQAGILEPAQAHAVFLALDLPADADRDSLRRLLTVWTDDIERLMSGRATLADLEPELARVPASITVTVGVGPRAVQVAAGRAPSWLAPLPAYSIDRLDPRWCGGDLFVQICADSPTTVAHAQRRMLTNMGSLARIRWIQRGFREPFEGEGIPMRNLLGQVDGTVQPEVAGAEAHLLWIDAGGSREPEWLTGGSSVVVRRIAMDLDAWDRADRTTRENAIGRHLGSGAPLTAPADAPATEGADLLRTDALGFHASTTPRICVGPASPSRRRKSCVDRTPTTPLPGPVC